MSNRKPYFYIIQDKDTGKKYAGAKWGHSKCGTNKALKKGVWVDYV